MPLRRVHMMLVVATSAVVGMLVLGLTLPAAPPPSDWLLTLQARNALWERPSLSKLNVAVTVHDGIVVISGTVASLAQIEEADKVVRGLTGVREVVNELYVPPVDRLEQPVPRPSSSARPSVPTPGVPATETQKVLEPPTAVKAAPPPPTLAERIDQVRAGDRRYRDIRFDVQGGRVTLRGSVAKSQDAWDFAREVGRLPGVSGVSQNIATAQ
ncbi:MAG: BON domain-containing protein [Gemmataceae bacterium]